MLAEDGTVNLVHDVIAVLPYAVGWLVGVIVRGLAWLRDAIVAGYEAGRGGNEWA